MLSAYWVPSMSTVLSCGRLFHLQGEELRDLVQAVVIKSRRAGLKFVDADHVFLHLVRHRWVLFLCIRSKKKRPPRRGQMQCV